MKAKPDSAGVIAINGNAGYVSLHPNQIWEATYANNQYRMQHKFLILFIDEALFNKMFKLIE